MRNLKKLLAVVVAICVLATFTVPAFAETKTDAQIAADLGVIKGAGTGVTAEYLATTPDRLQGAIMFLRLKGLEDTAKAFVGTDNFADVEGLNDTNQAILAYLKANPDLGFAGVGDNKFSPLTKMTAKEYYKVMLVALGYVYETDFTWANVLSFAASKGLLKNIDKDTFTVNDLCIATVEALGTPVKGGTDKLIAKLVDGGSITSAAAVASGLYTAVAKALEVVSVSSDNLKTAKIVFNKELDSASVVKANFSNSDVTTDPKLLDDKKTVLVVFDTAKAQSATADVVLENVKATDGVKIAKVTKTVTFVDTTIPVISGVVAKNAKALVISASEPMNFIKAVPQILSDIKIDGANSIGSTAIDYAKNTITLNLVSLLTAGTHKVDISGLKDFANYTAVATSFNVEVAADTTAPSITSAKMNNLKEIEVTFSEDIDVDGSFWVNGVAVASAVKQSNPAVFKLGLANDLDIGATVVLTIEYKGQKDVQGNEVTTKTSFTGFKVTDDTAVPTVTAAIDKDNKITLTFSKTMYEAGSIKVVKASDNSVLHTFTIAGAGAAFKADTNKTVIELAAADTGINNIDGYDIKVIVKDAKDGTVRKNPMAETTLTLKALDTNEPTVGNFYTASNNGTADPKDDYVTFFFNEAMDSATLNSLSNYVLTSNSAISLASLSGTSVKEVASDAKSVKIIVPGIATSCAPTYADQSFAVYALKDVAGNMCISNTNVTRYGGSAFGVVGTTVNAVATDKIEIEFNTLVNAFDPSVFTVRNTGATTDAAWAISYSGLNTTKIAITLNQKIGTDAAGKVLYLNDGTKASNVYGVTLGAIAPLTIVDKISPTASVAAATTPGSILVTFSENMTGTTYADLATDLKVMKGSTPVALTGTSITFRDANDAVVAAGATFKKVEITGLTSGTEYSVAIFPSVLTDTNTNKVAAFDKASYTAN